jgi:hypothetical protein
MIYFAQADGIGHIKIGFTDQDDVLLRIAQLQTGCPVTIRLLGTIPGTAEDEKNLHRQFAAHRSSGEWFKSAPDILAMIPSSDSPICGDVTTDEVSISIRILTVGRKKFSKSLLYQLPVISVFDWSAVMEQCSEEDSWDYVNLLPFVNGDVWGWVHDGVRWIIFVRKEKLCRWQDRDGECPYDLAKEHGMGYVNLLKRRRSQLPGFRPEDQLFFGV